MAFFDDPVMIGAALTVVILILMGAYIYLRARRLIDQKRASVALPSIGNGMPRGGNPKLRTR